MSEMSVQPSPAQMSPNERMAAAAERAESLLEPAVGAKLKGFLTPQALGILAATTGVWAVAQFTPIGWVADLAAAALGAAAVVGAGALGYDIGGGINELIDFVKVARAAQTNAALNAAAQHLANAVSTLGVDTVQAVILHKGAGEANPKIAAEAVAEAKNPELGHAPSACAACAAAKTDAQADKPVSNSKVYRVQGGGSQERIIEQDGKIKVVPNAGKTVQTMLFVTIDDIDRARTYINVNRPDGKIVSFEVNPIFVAKVRANAISAAEAKIVVDGKRITQNKPQIADPTKTDNSFGLPPDWIKALEEHAVPGTFKIEHP